MINLMGGISGREEDDARTTGVPISDLRGWPHLEKARDAKKLLRERSSAAVGEKSLFQAEGKASAEAQGREELVMLKEL